MSRPQLSAVAPAPAARRRVPPTPTPAPGAVAPLPQDCAQAVLDVMPKVMDAMRAAMRAQVADQLSVPQFRCLNFIARVPGSSVSAVAGFLGVTLPTASVMVDRLVRAGAVAPATAVRDRRRTELQVTAAGLAQLRQAEAGARTEFARVLSRCSPEDLRSVQVGLAVLHGAFQPA